MKIQLIAIGKTDSKELLKLIAEYQKRLTRYVQFELNVIPDIKNSKNISQSEQKQREGTSILSLLQSSDYVVLLDERGHQHSSEEFAQYLQSHMNSGVKRLVFAIGGPYGFSQEVYSRANEKISLSKMTFSHQMVRLFFVEQIYRGFAILAGSPYHHS